MTRRIFVAATGQHCGKTTASLLFFRAARELFGRVGFIKPLGQEYRVVDDLKIDKDALLFADVFGLREHLRHMSPVVADRGFTRRFLDGEVQEEHLVASIEESFAALERHCDAIVIEGTGHSGVGAVLGLSNARVARLLDAPVTMVTGGGIGSVADRVHLALPLYEKEGADVRTIFANKLLPDKRDQAVHYLQKAFAAKDLSVFAGLSYNAQLDNPSVRTVAHFVGVEPESRHTDSERLVATVQMGVASCQRVVDLLERDTLVVTAGTRDELLVTLASLYEIEEYRDRIAGVLATGKPDVSPITERILQSSGLPYLRTRENSTVVLTRLMDYQAKLGPEDTTKLEVLFRQGGRELESGALGEFFST